MHAAKICGDSYRLVEMSILLGNERMRYLQNLRDGITGGFSMEQADSETGDCLT